MSGWLAGWRPALRLAWRDALRSKGRSALVLVMIALPVIAVSAAAVVAATSTVGPAESLERRMGAADALVLSRGDVGAVLQDADPQRSFFDTTDRGGEVEASTFDIDSLSGVLGRELTSLPLQTGYVGVRSGDRVVDVAITQTDLADPLAAGLFDLHDGRWPRDEGEVVINGALAERGFALGDTLDVEAAGGALSPTVVGIGDDATQRTSPTAAGPWGSLGAPDVTTEATWLVGAGGPITWPEVLRANLAGVFVVSRAVLEDPPPADQLPPEVAQGIGDSSGEELAAIILVVTMALLEVVLLAGPAFAVGARRQSRTLALMAACGGTPRQARRVILASGVVLGGLAAGVGAVVGIVAGIGLLPLVQRFSGTWFGPLEVPVWPVVGVGAFGLVSALLAAVVPAVLASRQDVVAVLAGRRGDGAPSRRSPVLGLILLGVGSAGSAYGATMSNGTDAGFLIAGCAIVAILGMILLVPLVVSTVARLGARLPLSLRYAARDAARHRTRTAPAVAAVAATVAGVVALGIGASSDEREKSETYRPILAMGDGTVAVSPGWDPATQTEIEVEQVDLDEVEEVVRSRVETVEPITGVATRDGDDSLWINLLTPDDQMPLSTWGGTISTPFLIADDRLPAMVRLADEADRPAAEAALRGGTAVVFADQAVAGDEVIAEITRYDLTSEDDSDDVERVTLPAHFVEVVPGTAPAPGVVGAARAQELGLPLVTNGFYLPQSRLGADAQADLEEEVSAVTENASVYIERGYQQDDEALVVLIVLGALGGVLMLGGTLTATFLALSDARPDLATLSAVGASPRKRRAVAAAYALVVGGVGALLGAAVGFVPGLAIVRSLTYLPNGLDGGTPSGPFYDVPWLMILVLVVVLPLVTAAIVGFTARSRLPLASRLE